MMTTINIKEILEKDIKVLEKVDTNKYMLSNNNLYAGQTFRSNKVTEDGILMWYNPETKNCGWIYTFEEDNLKIDE